jgi:hypothetical protein
MFCARKQNYIQNYLLQNARLHQIAQRTDYLFFFCSQNLPDRDIHIEKNHIGFYWVGENSVIARISSPESEKDCLELFEVLTAVVRMCTVIQDITPYSFFWELTGVSEEHFSSVFRINE